MSDSLNRGSLLSTCLLLRPALASGDYIPALQHIRFDGKYATAFNDISAIAIKTNADLSRCLPGEWLIRALQSFNAETVNISQKDTEVQLSSGRSKLKAPTLPETDFPLKWPEDGEYEIDLTPSIIRGVERCLLSVGADPNHPEQMGVTLDEVDGRARLFSSDNWSISSYETGEKIKLPGGPVILPTFFCQQLVSLAKAYGGKDEEPIALVVHDGAIVAEFGKEFRLLSKTVAAEPSDFPEMLKKHLKLKDLAKELVAIPDGFDTALQRSLLVLQAEDDKAMQVEPSAHGINLLSEGMGEADDDLRTEDNTSFDAPDVFHLDPQLVARGAKAAALMGFLPRAMVLADEKAHFLHLIAYCTGKKKDKK